MLCLYSVTTITTEYEVKMTAASNLFYPFRYCCLTLREQYVLTQITAGAQSWMFNKVSVTTAAAAVLKPWFSYLWSFRAALEGKSFMLPRLTADWTQRFLSQQKLALYLCLISLVKLSHHSLVFSGSASPSERLANREGGRFSRGCLSQALWGLLSCSAAPNLDFWKVQEAPEFPPNVLK